MRWCKRSRDWFVIVVDLGYWSSIYNCFDFHNSGLKLIKVQSSASYCFLQGLLHNFNHTFPIPPHHGARSMIKFHVMRLSAKYRITSSDSMIFLISLDADLKVLALSDWRVMGNPRWLTNLLKANRNDATLREGVSSRWIALVEAQVNIQMHTLSETFSFEDSPSLRMYSGPMKSNPVWANGGSIETRSIGRSGVCGCL